MRQIRLILAALAILLAAGPAAAAESIGERLCYLHTDEDSTLRQALARRGECRTGDRSLAGPRVWGFVERRATGNDAETAL
ncbi:MAG: hypothetical protein ABR601_06660, partial [Parasphingopyxis sp.]